MSALSERSDSPTASRWAGLWLAVVLSLAAAVSLGVTRFSYALLLPPMRDDLAWSYTLAGAMNTFNALGYLVGALTTPVLMRFWGPARLLVAGAALSSLFMASSGFFVASEPLLAQRLLAGVSSAWVFISGGLLAAHLGSRWPHRSGLLLGIYYGGTGWGIVASALLVPWLLDTMAHRPHPWTWAWWMLALLCALATVALAGVVRKCAPPPARSSNASSPGTTSPTHRATWRAFGPALLGYSLFGMGYIGYMTFVVAVLRDHGTSTHRITLFYALLGLAVVASSRLWSGLLDRHRGGQPLARLCGLLGLATVLPAWTTAWPLLLMSGLLFGAVFLSVVASTTALVRHNWPPDRWAAGISAFTVVFAIGQIVGPTVVGWIADGPGGLQRGLMFSAIALWAGAIIAACQKPLAR